MVVTLCGHAFELEFQRSDYRDLNVLGRVLQTRALGSLCSLDLAGNRISDEGISAFSTAISSGAMGSLQALYVDDSIYHPALKVVCEARGIDL